MTKDNILNEHNKKEKEKANKRRDEYNKNPHLCMFCGEPILMNYEDKYRDVFKKKFCSTACASKYRKVNPVNFYTHIDKFSDDEIIEIFNNSSDLLDFSNKLGYTHRIVESQNKVVSRLRSIGIDINELKKGEKLNLSNRTKGELFSVRSNWQSARSSIQRDARRVYQDSEKPKKCACCGYDKHYEVAHIKAVSDFDDDVLISEINDIDNLIALCPNHHWEYDNIGLDTEDLKNNYCEGA